MKIRVEWRVKLPAGDGRFIRWSRYLFLGAGVLVLGYVALVLLDARMYQGAQAQRFQQELDGSPPAIAGDAPLQSPALHPTGNGARFAPPDILGFRTSGNPPLGRIDISSIGLTAMIQEGTDARTLRRSVGHIPGTSLPGRKGNVAITGHRDTFFRPLNRIRRGDEITLTTLEGLYRYRVDSTQVVEPEDMALLADSADAVLTLVTCYPFYFVGPAPRRFIVRAHMVDRGQGTSSSDRTGEQ